MIAQGQGQEHQHAGYRPKAVDLTAYWRPALRGLKTKHYCSPAGKALPAVVLGIIVRVGSVNEQRAALITDLVRTDPDDPPSVLRLGSGECPPMGVGGAPRIRLHATGWTAGKSDSGVMRTSHALTWNSGSTHAFCRLTKTRLSVYYTCGSVQCCRFAGL